MLSCKEIARLCASEEIHRCGPLKKMLFTLHHFLCRGCKDYEKQLMAVGDLARKSSAEPEREIVADLENEILKKLKIDTSS